MKTLQELIQQKDAYGKSPIIKTCKGCGVPFMAKYRKDKVKYCTSACSSRARMKSDAKYSAIHMYLRYHYKKTGVCELCKTKAKTDWAKKHDRSYTRLREDYYELCKSCHNSYDFTDERKKRFALSKMGIPAVWRWKPVILTKGGVSKRYVSATHAAKAIGTPPLTVSHVARRRKGTIKGFTAFYDVK